MSRKAEGKNQQRNDAPRVITLCSALNIDEDNKTRCKSEKKRTCPIPEPQRQAKPALRKNGKGCYDNDQAAKTKHDLK